MGGSGTSLAIIPTTGDLNVWRRFRKSLRQIRDRQAHYDYRFCAVSIAGLLSGNAAMVLIHHPGIARAEVWSTLSRRWPDIVLDDPGDIEPSFEMTVADAAEIARRRRGIEPLRIVVMPQVVASEDRWGEPYPIAF
jgi:hypothetical protein